MANPTYNVLFVCTGNSARSIMAEVLLNSLGRGRFKAYSAGSQPGGSVNPLTLELLQGKGLSVAGLRSKSWDEFGKPGAPPMDFIFTLCDKAAGEACPTWPGHPLTAHWGFENPAQFAGSHDERFKHFEHVFQEISTRLRLFLALPIEKLDRLSLQKNLRNMGSA